MTKPFIGNLIIDFTIRNDSGVEAVLNPLPIDPITGNPITEDLITGNPYENTILYRVKAYIKGMPSIMQEMGSNPNILQVEGKIVETWNNQRERWENIKILPVELIRYQSEANAFYIDPVSKFEQVCYFTLSPDVDSRRPRVARRLARRLGSNIKGNLRF